MHLIRVAMAGLVVGLGVSMNLHALPGQSDLPVTTIISDFDSGIAPALQIQSDKAGAYLNSKSLTSMMWSAGIWELAPGKNATRTVYFGFNQAIPGSGPNGGAPVGLPSGLYSVNVSTKCYNYGTNPLTMAPGSTISCPMRAAFDTGGKSYTIHMNPQNATWTGTNPVTITCIFPTGGTAPCSQWKITPSGSVVNPDSTTTYRSVGQLDLVETRRGQTTYTKQGQFYFSFLILVMSQ